MCVFTPRAYLVVQTLSSFRNQDDNVLWLQPQRTEDKFRSQLRTKCVFHPRAIYAFLIRGGHKRKYIWGNPTYFSFQTNNILLWSYPLVLCMLGVKASSLVHQAFSFIKTLYGLLSFSTCCLHPKWIITPHFEQIIWMYHVPINLSGLVSPRLSAPISGHLCSLKILVLFRGQMNLCSGCKCFPHQRRISNMNTKCLFSVYHFFFLVRLSSFFCLLQFAVVSHLNSRLEILLTMLSGHLAISIQVEFNHKFMRRS